ncbi:hypothetical protein GYA93_05175 [Gordonia desulfuricans]|uniref:Uncharacterized protein n=1 Tax=Gordonia desulfuricans TaxID=89051 RepID=A0A7K3LLD6_9ACTN|nr:hypothetical protein [Gordonia desulfuricans]NDK88973.1 hypothetical protein [Gordonia desulfuricans]
MARTEYETPQHRIAGIGAMLLAVAALVMLIVSSAVGVSGTTTAVTVGVLLSGSMLAGATARTMTRPAVVLGVDGTDVYLGDEQSGIVSRPLGSVVSASLGTASTTTTVGAGAVRADPHDLLIRGMRWADIVFATPEPEGWRIAVAVGDPAAEAVLDVLRAAAPRRRKATAEPSPPSEPPGPPSEPPGPPADGTRGGPAAGTTENTTIDDGAGPMAEAGSEDASRRLWEEATRRHDDVLGRYGWYELDPAMLLTYPAVIDVTLTHVQDFLVALEDANALRTDAYPGDRARADAYRQAVTTLRRTWTACEAEGRRLGAGYLDDPDRDSLRTALKLYRHAEGGSTSEEQAAYIGRVRDIVGGLVDRGAIHPTTGALEQLETVSRRMIESPRER